MFSAIMYTTHVYREKFEAMIVPGICSDSIIQGNARFRSTLPLPMTHMDVFD